MIRAVIFDFDGLIIDTEGPAYDSWQQIYAAQGCSLPLEVWATRIGVGQEGFDPCAYLEGQVGRPLDPVAVRREREALKAELAAAQPLLPGVREYLCAAHELGLKTAVASSSSRTWVLGHLTRLGLLADFNCIKCGGDVPRTKPAPDLYLAVLAALDLPATAALALEDSPNGIAAAKGAGLFCVAVPNPLTARLALDQADLQLASLADLPLPALLDHVLLIQTGRAGATSG